jgi:hypothetical protein
MVVITPTEEEVVIRCGVERATVSPFANWLYLFLPQHHDEVSSSVAHANSAPAVSVCTLCSFESDGVN